MKKAGQRSPASGFDKLARPYRWLEYLTFGSMLMQSRLAFLPQMLGARRALVLGDGDGRFCSSLLRANPTLCVHAVDGSAAMLEVLRYRATCAGAEQRLTTHLQDVRNTLPEGSFDLVCTHFLLDCLSQDEVVHLVQAVRERMSAGSWVVSEFAVPSGGARWPALLLVGTLYRAFGILTGLEVRHLPRHDVALQAAGYTCVSCRIRLFGVLRSELWNLRRDEEALPRKLEVR